MKLKDLFSYNPKTGVLTWKISRRKWVKVGQVAGGLHVTHKGQPYSRKYLVVGVHLAGHSSCLMVHRIAYELMTGESIPRGMQIDHKNGDGTDNRWKNLRLATRSQNMANRSVDRTKKRGLPKGVFWHGRDRAYVASVAGRFVKQSKSLQEAKDAYNAAAKAHYGDFARP